VVLASTGIYSGENFKQQ